MEENKEVQEIHIDGVLVSLMEFQQKSIDPNVRLKEISPNNYKTLQRMMG